MWIFGYGSLVWRPSLPFVENHVGYVTGWSRRFWQGSTDHRGVPGLPGRVVTLVSDPEGQCWGRAFRIAEELEEEVVRKLDQREQGGYDKHWLPVHLDGDEGRRTVRGLVYVATSENPNYLGPAPVGVIAAQIRASRGPSGSNLEYVEQLATALREMKTVDEHVFELARVLNLEDSRRPGP